MLGFELNELKWAREILTKEFRETKPKSLGNDSKEIVNEEKTSVIFPKFSFQRRWATIPYLAVLFRGHPHITSPPFWQFLTPPPPVIMCHHF